MHVIVDFCLVPLGVGVSVSKYVAACQRVLDEAGLDNQLHAYGTNIEGEWEEVFAAVRRCHEVVHEMGAPRITTTIRLGTRTDRLQTMDDKLSSVEKQLLQSLTLLNPVLYFTTKRWAIQTHTLKAPLPIRWNITQNNWFFFRLSAFLSQKLLPNYHKGYKIISTAWL